MLSARMAPQRRMADRSASAAASSSPVLPAPVVGVPPQPPGSSAAGGHGIASARPPLHATATMATARARAVDRRRWRRLGRRAPVGIAPPVLELLAEVPTARSSAAQVRSEGVV